ncbi:hypothetical protein CO045_01425 [Candidatus Peregrinibacteria bacterium CG_4_9_14_0_2_um_filter_41_14]|nr:MAG: hypothetical protein CO045_01425 [Candidatus Peregrinibacteria bacterium CG_4_9_14_0_2_um_filter_41_14]
MQLARINGNSLLHDTDLAIEVLQVHRSTLVEVTLGFEQILNTPRLRECLADLQQPFTINVIVPVAILDTDLYFGFKNEMRTHVMARVVTEVLVDGSYYAIGYFTEK